MIAIKLTNVNIQYSLRRERPSNSAYFLQTIKYHSIALFLSSLILESSHSGAAEAAAFRSHSERTWSIFWR
jgi:hypothetical protein